MKQEDGTEQLNNNGVSVFNAETINKFSKPHQNEAE